MDTGKYETLIFNISDSIARVTMNRPDVHNAFNRRMLSDLIEAFEVIRDMGTEVRAVVLTGEGKSFCAGADLKWMKEMVNYSYEENIEDSTLIADCMRGLYTLPQPPAAAFTSTGNPMASASPTMSSTFSVEPIIPGIFGIPLSERN